MKYTRTELAKARARSRLSYLVAEVGLLCKWTGCPIREVVLSVNEKAFAVPDTLVCPGCERVLEVAYIRGSSLREPDPPDPVTASGPPAPPSSVREP